jgi:hypothetical protein|tara:strand:+ start:664 stop:909 length:246 start_codon:yes stop_codon:yes gene_type:complete
MSKTIIFNLENPTGVERDLTSEEQVQLDADIAKAKEEKTLADERVAKKNADAKAGNNKLIELGLTQDQVTAMTGYVPPSEE